MQRMGIQQQEIEAIEVIIRCADKDIIIAKPTVAKVNMMGEETWQISGQSREQAKSVTPDIKEEDIQTVMQQAKVSHEQALAAIKEAKGNMAEAILTLTQN